MKQNLILLVITALILATVHCNLIRRKRLSHAKDAEKNAWPSQVLILTGEEYYRICGGTIINEAWVLTAAHCVRTNEGRDPMTYKLVFGEHNRQVDDGTEIRRNIAKIIRYPKYEMQNHSFDVALVRMDTPLDFSDPKMKHLKPICLVLNGIDVTDKKCISTGFGRTGRGNAKMADVLQQLEMKLFDHTECAKIHQTWYMYEDSKEEVTENQVCFVTKENPYPDSGDSYGGGCPGDSGGPLQCEAKGVWFQVGVTWSATDCEQNPTVYNLVHKYAGFIKETTGYTLPDYCFHAKRPLKNGIKGEWLND